MCSSLGRVITLPGMSMCSDGVLIVKWDLDHRMPMIARLQDACVCCWKNWTARGTMKIQAVSLNNRKKAFQVKTRSGRSCFLLEGGCATECHRSNRPGLCR